LEIAVSARAREVAMIAEGELIQRCIRCSS